MRKYSRRYERWKTIKDYPDYQVSNRGKVKSFKKGREKILKGCISNVGYLIVSLNGKTKQVHQLVAICFLGHKPCWYKLVVNHKDFNKLNNNVNNLEIVSARENSNLKHIKSSSKYTGVSWHKNRNKWQSNITLYGKNKHIGYFTNEIEASIAYQNYLKLL